jgi:preprotein translocase subunit SecG
MSVTSIFSELSIETTGLLAFNASLLFMEVLLFVTSLFLMLLVLVQRGKGGGLTGALGGMGGQSAFGSKAGDAFTKITVVTAVIWITLCMLTIAAFNPPPPPQSVERKLQQQSGSMESTGDTDTENAEARDDTLPGEGTEAAPGDSASESSSSADNADLSTLPATDDSDFELELEAPATNPSEEAPSEEAPSEEAPSEEAPSTTEPKE